MATRIVQGNLARVRVACTAGNQASINTFVYEATAATGLGAFDTEFATERDFTLSTLYQALLSVSATYFGVSVQIIRPAPPTCPVVDVTNQGAGLVTGDLLPKQSAGLISWKTLACTRRDRGRSYIPFPGEGDNTGLGVPQTTYITRLDNLAAPLIGPITVGMAPDTTTLQLGVYHRLFNEVTLVTTHVSRPRWATQRRRGDFGRLNAPPF